MYEDQIFLDRQEASERFCSAVYAMITPEEERKALRQAYDGYVRQCKEKDWTPVSWEVFLRG